MAGENKSLPGLSAPFSPLRRRAPHLDGCAGVSPTEVLKGNREALPRRVQVVLNYLKVKGKTSGELWPGGWGAAILFLPICSLFLCVPNLGSHKSQETLSHPTPPPPIPGGLTPQICMPGAISHHPGGRTPRMDPISPGSPVNTTETCYQVRKKQPLCQTPVPRLTPNTPFQSPSFLKPQGLLLHTPSYLGFWPLPPWSLHDYPSAPETRPG